MRVFLLILLLAPRILFSQCPAGVPPNFTATTTASICASDGSITVNGTNGLPPYLYEITAGPVVRITQSSNVFSGLPAGTYTVKMVDNCGTIVTKSVTVPGSYVAHTFTVTQQKVTCPGGSDGKLTISVSGGTAPYSYSLIAPSPVIVGPQASNVFSGLPAGNYTIRVVDNCGSIKSTVFTLETLVANPLYLSSTSVVFLNCSTLRVSLYSNGGAIPYQYQIASPGPGAYQSSNIFDIPVASGNYTFRVKDACGRTADLNYSTAPAINALASYTCTSNSISVYNIRNLMAPIMYEIISPINIGPQASPVFNGLAPGTYTVRATDACGRSATVNVLVNPPPLNPTLGIAYQMPGCDGKTRIAFSVSTLGGFTITKTAGPGAPFTFTSSSGGSFTYHMSTHFDPGAYTFKLTDLCGNSVFLNTNIIAYTPDVTYTLTPTCFGANITAITPTASPTPPAGWNSSFSYSIDGINFQTANFFNNVAPGTHVLTIKNAGCNYLQKNIVVLPLTFPSLQVSGTICSGGSNLGNIFAQTTGGLAPYQYEIISGPSGPKPLQSSNTFTGLPNGVYQVRTIDACGNSDIKGFELTNYGQNNVHQNAPCYGQAFTMYADTLPSASYTWTGPNGFSSNQRFITINPFTAANVGNYTLTVVYSTCINVTFTVVVPPPANNATFTSTNICGNSPNIVNITGNTGGTFSFNPNPGDGATINATTGVVSNAVTGNSYSIQYTVVAGACVSSSIVTITATTLNLSSANTNVLCNGASTGASTITASNGIAPYGYTWPASAGGQTTNPATNLGAGTYVVTVNDANSCSKTISVTITQPTAITVTPSQANVLCNGASTGTATATVTGGTTPPAYTYTWSNGQTSNPAINLAAGSYTVTVKDGNNCTKTQSYTITQPVAITITPSQVNVACSGGSNGSATATVTGGIAPYTYTWSNGQTSNPAINLAAGTYTVTVRDANNCTKTQSYTINQSGSVVITPSQVNVLCNGASTGTATATASGGTAPYTYAWPASAGNQVTSTATNLAAGTYIVTVRDVNNCTQTRSYTITQPTAITVTPSQVNVLCNGNSTGSATATPSGGTSPYTYTWPASAGNQTTATATNLLAGTYIVTVKDANNCTKTQSYTIAQPTAITITPSQVNILCNGASIGSATATVSGGTPGYTYAWPVSAGSQTTATATNLAAGTYIVTVRDANNCIKTQSYTITQSTAIVITPTQTNNICNGGSTGTATATPSGGNSPYSYAWPVSAGSQTTATAINLTTGTYIVTVTDGFGCTKTQSYTITQPTAITVTPSQANVLCNGASTGTATATVTGGTTPPAYTYTWSNGQTSNPAINLAAGSYTVTVKDGNNCTKTQSYTITQPVAITITPSQVNVACSGGSNGSATATVTGGIAPYTYTWSNGQTSNPAINLAAGTYTVTVRDANNCTKTQSYTINQSGSVVITPSQVNVLCNGASTGTATATASGGTAPYTYAWPASAGNQVTSTATNLAAGTYIVTVRDVNNCSQTGSYTITQPTAITVTPSQVNIACNGGSTGSATATPAGGVGGYTYIWPASAGNQTTATATNLPAGTYIVTVKDANNCEKTQSYTITESSSISVSSVQTNVLCNGNATGSATLTPSGGAGTYTYAWPASAGNQTTATATNLSAGTYVVTVNDQNNCTKSYSLTITEPTAISIVPTQLDVLCNGAATGTATATASGGTTPPAYTYTWSNGQTTNPAINLAAGSYTVTVKDGNNCTKTQLYTILQPSVITITPSQVDVLCNGAATGTATATVTGGTTPPAYTYTWSNGQTSNPAINLAAGSYTVTVKDGNNCTKTQSYTISQATAITVTPSQVNIACNGGSTGSATATPSGGNSNYFYTWDANAGNQTTQTAINLAAGTYTVTVRDGNNCTKTQSYTITESTSLNSQINSDSVSCMGLADGAAYISVSGGSPTYTYLWSANALSSLNDTVTGLSIGIYYVTVTDANNCTKVDSLQIVEPTLLAVQDSLVHLLCNSDSTGKAFILANGGVSPYSYQWSSNIAHSNADSAFVLATGNYAVTVFDHNNCSTSHAFQITEPDPIQALVIGHKPLCLGDSNGTASISVIGGTPGYTYLWDANAHFQDSSVATGLPAGFYQVEVTDSLLCKKSFTVNILGALPIVYSNTLLHDEGCGLRNGSVVETVSGGTGAISFTWSTVPTQTDSIASNLSGGWYYVTISDVNNCLKFDSIFVPIDYTVGGPLLDIAIKDVSCLVSVDGKATITPTTGVAPYTYTWDNNPNNQDSATAFGLDTGVYFVTVMDSLHCYTDTFVTIGNMNNLPILTMSSTDPTCHGFNNGTATVIINAGNDPYAIHWSNLDSLITTDSLAPAMYYVSVVDSVGCFANDSVEIFETPLIAPVINGSPYVCHGDSAHLNVTSSTTITSYVWNTGDTTSTISTQPLMDTIYIVTVSNGICFEEDSFSLEVKPLPTVLTITEDSICVGGLATIKAFTDNGIYFIWSTGDTTQTIMVPTGLDPEPTYGVTVTDTFGCKNDTVSDVTTILYFPIAEANFDTSRNSIFQNEFFFYDSSKIDVIKWNWDFGDGNHSELFNPKNSYVTPGTYDVTLIVENKYGCKDTATKQIVVNQSIIIPNIFSPNGDGYNDFFTIPTTDANLQYELVILNRWGQELFRTTDQRIVWNGRTLSGDEVPEGTYMFYFTSKGITEHKLAGTVTLVR